MRSISNRFHPKLLQKCPGAEPIRRHSLQPASVEVCCGNTSLRLPLNNGSKIEIGGKRRSHIGFAGSKLTCTALDVEVTERGFVLLHHVNFDPRNMGYAFPQPVIVDHELLVPNLPSSVIQSASVILLNKALAARMRSQGRGNAMQIPDLYGPVRVDGLNQVPTRTGEEARGIWTDFWRRKTIAPGNLMDGDYRLEFAWSVESGLSLRLIDNSILRLSDPLNIRLGKHPSGADYVQLSHGN